VPVPYAASVLQISLLWAGLTLLLSAGAWEAWLLFGLVLVSRYVLAGRIDQTLGLAKAGEAWLFLVRDMVSATIYIASYLGDKVDWRGQTMTADRGRAELPTKP
jgi:ceramide glucosyltransferase